MGVEPSVLTLILNKKHSRHGLLFQSTISLHLKLYVRSYWFENATLKSIKKSMKNS